MRYLTRTVLKLVVCGIGIVPLYSGQAAFAEAKEKVVHFPENRSMGMLYVLDSNKVDTSSYYDWQVLCEATGDVTVPAGKALRLNLAKKAGNNLSPLSKLRPDDLTMLFCYGVEIVDEQLKHISHLSGLQELYMRDTGILGTGLKYLTKLKSLEKLRVDNTHVGDNELAYLSDLPSLKSLNIWMTPASDAGMIHVGKIASLESLVLSRGVGDEGLSHLKNLTSLRHFYAGNQSTSDEGLKHLANMTEMENLDLSGTQVSDDGLVHLKKMKKLKSLDLFRTNTTEKGLVHLVVLKKLEWLELPFAVGDAALVYLSKFPSLKMIEINGDSITPKSLDALSKMKSIEQMYVGGQYNKDAIINKLSDLSGLKSLDIRRGLTDKGLMRLKNMKSLHELQLDRAQITSKGFKALAELPSLRVLSFSYMEIPSKECWIHLGKLTSLQRLEFDNIQPGITDGNIAYLTDLHSLKYLNINQDRKQPKNITNMALKHISKLQSLERLTLHGAKITDEGLKHLEKLDSLKWIDLQRCEVTEEGLQQLNNKLPALRWHLDRDSLSIQPPSLVGKPLLKLKDFKLNLSLPESNEKKMLVCFFDMNQRPSRNCIMQLAKRAEELKQQGITLIAVQASKINENTLNERIKKNDISFPVGMIEGNEEKIRFTWGVRSLPWLILTDTKHIVHTEGFNLSELDAKIKEVAP